MRSELNTLKKVAELIINNDGGYVSAKTLGSVLPIELTEYHIRYRTFDYINKYKEAFSLYSITTEAFSLYNTTLEFSIFYKDTPIAFL